MLSFLTENCVAKGERETPKKWSHFRIWVMMNRQVCYVFFHRDLLGVSCSFGSGGTLRSNSLYVLFGVELTNAYPTSYTHRRSLVFIALTHRLSGLNLTRCSSVSSASSPITPTFHCCTLDYGEKKNNCTSQGTAVEGCTWFSRRSSTTPLPSDEPPQYLVTAKYFGAPYFT